MKTKWNTHIKYTRSPKLTGHSGAAYYGRAENRTEQKQTRGNCKGGITLKGRKSGKAPLK